MWQFLLDFLFPRRSLSGEAGLWITDAERAQLKSFPVVEHTDALRKRGLTSLDGVWAGSAYRDCPMLKKAIRTFKYGRVRLLSWELATVMLAAVPPLEGAVLCPVPLHWTRRLERGFNQSDLLASLLSQKLSVPKRTLLRRAHATGHQAWRKRGERLTALQDVFRVCGTSPKNVILVDDLATTGATLDACARALKEAGAERVYGWVIAHG
ncbi:MAG: phosphoribosyltransferase family protein [Candidatus Peregrinibacteria bacterium]